MRDFGIKMCEHKSLESNSTDCYLKFGAKVKCDLWQILRALYEVEANITERQNKSKE